MSKEDALEIVQRLQSDRQFHEQIFKKVKEGKFNEILQILKESGIQVDSKDLKLALDTNWIIENLEEPSESISHLLGLSAGNQKQAGQPGKIDLRENLQEGLVEVVKQIDRGYERVMQMYTVAFYIGVIMVLMSVFASLVLHSDTSALILGGLGMADIIASLIYQPAQELQNSRGNLAQLQAAFFNWINDIYNWNRYLRLMDEEATSDKRPPSFNNVCEVSDKMVHNTERMMEMIEKYCETPEKNRNKEKSSKSA
jgi:hypothetical protein